MRKPIVIALLFASACLQTACQTAPQFRHTASVVPTPHILHVLKLASEQSALLKGDLSEGDPYKIDNPFNTYAETCEKRHEADVWAIQVMSEDLVSLVTCSELRDHLVHVRTYRRNDGLELVLVASERGSHGQTWSFEFFDFDSRTNRLLLRSPDSLGVVQPRENEFLTKKEKLQPSENHFAFFYLNEDGAIETSPWTWMEKRWEDRNVAFKILFKWNGSSFTKTFTKAD